MSKLAVLSQTARSSVLVGQGLGTPEHMLQSHVDGCPGCLGLDKQCYSEKGCNSLIKTMNFTSPDPCPEAKLLAQRLVLFLTWGAIFHVITSTGHEFVLFSPPPRQQLLFLSFLITAILTVVRRQLFVVLVGISLVTLGAIFVPTTISVSFRKMSIQVFWVFYFHNQIVWGLLLRVGRLCHTQCTQALLLAFPSGFAPGSVWENPVGHMQAGAFPTVQIVQPRLFLFVSLFILDFAIWVMWVFFYTLYQIFDFQISSLSYRQPFSSVNVSLHDPTHWR